MLQGFLKEQGIETDFITLYLCISRKLIVLWDTGREFPVSEKLSKEILSLPMFPSLTERQQERLHRVSGFFPANIFRIKSVIS
jgi:dTDP-4-amino-4,6-dideoxygalactose transaminase